MSISINLKKVNDLGGWCYLSCACLTISEDRAVTAFQDLANDRACETIIDLVLCCFFSKSIIKIEISSFPRHCHQRDLAKLARLWLFSLNLDNGEEFSFRKFNLILKCRSASNRYFHPTDFISFLTAYHSSQSNHQKHSQRISFYFALHRKYHFIILHHIDSAHTPSTRPPCHQPNLTLQDTPHTTHEPLYVFPDISANIQHLGRSGPWLSGSQGIKAASIEVKQRQLDLNSQGKGERLLTEIS